MATERISQIIPFVKCSDCGANVSLRNLGTHVCSNMPPVPSLPILPHQKKDRYTPASSSPSSSPYTSSSSSSSNSSSYYSLDRPPAPSTSPLPTNSSSSSLRKYNDPVLARYGASPSNNLSSPTSDRYRHQQQDHPTYPSQKTPSSSSSSSSSSSPLPPPLSSPSPYGNYDQRSHSPSSKSGTSGFGNTYKNGASGSLDSLMADLMDSMNEAIDQCASPTANNQNLPTSMATSPPPSSGCAACQETFRRHDDPVMYESKRYHERCFTCTVCRIPLDLRRAHEHQSKLYCQRDFTLVKKKIYCASCEQAIENDQVPLKVLGKYYHPGHVRCYHCQDPLDEKSSYREHQGRVYCRRDYRKMTLPKCRGCEKPVEKEAVSSNELQGKWHMSCFGCQTCHKAFPDNTFYVFDNSPYCRRHYHQLNNSLCRSCDEPIEGPCAQTSEGWRFHPSCFTCNVCNCTLNDVYYMFERRIYCEPHIMELQQRRKVRAEKRKTHFGQI